MECACKYGGVEQCHQSHQQRFATGRAAAVGSLLDKNSTYRQQSMTSRREKGGVLAESNGLAVADSFRGQPGTVCAACASVTRDASLSSQVDGRGGLSTKLSGLPHCQGPLREVMAAAGREESKEEREQE